MQILHRTFKAGTFALAILGAGILCASSRSGSESILPTEADTSHDSGGVPAAFEASRVNSFCALAARTYDNLGGSAASIMMRCVDQQERQYGFVSR